MSDQRFIELLRQGVEVLLTKQGMLTAAVDDVTLNFVTADEPPSVGNIIRQSNALSVTHFLSQIMRSPGKIPEPILSDDMISLMQNRVRRGTADLTVKGFRVGQEAAWRVWMNVAFGLSEDIREVHGLLDRTSYLLGAYIERIVEVANGHIEAFRADLERGTPTSHRALIMAILEGQTIDPIAASRRLAYPLIGAHHGMVVWSDAISLKQGEFEGFLQDLSNLKGVGITMTLHDQPSSIWVWFSGECPAALSDLLRYYGLRAALGTRGVGLEGFVLTHKQALSAQDIAKPCAAQPVLLRFDQSRLAGLMLPQKEAFDAFVNDVLGALLLAEDVYRESLATYLAHGCNLARASAVLGVHRNTMQKRLERANDLLPEPLNSQNRIQIGAALEGVAYR